MGDGAAVVPAPKSFPVLCRLVSHGVGGVSRLAYRYVRDITQRGANAAHKNAPCSLAPEMQAPRLCRNFRIVSIRPTRCFVSLTTPPTSVDSCCEASPHCGGREDILTAAEKYRIQEIILAIPSASARQQKRNSCNLSEDRNAPLRTLPALYQLANGEVRYSEDPQCGN